MFGRKKKNNKHPPTEKGEVNRPGTDDPSKKNKLSDNNNDMDRKMAAVELDDDSVASDASELEKFDEVNNNTEGINISFIMKSIINACKAANNLTREDLLPNNAMGLLYPEQNIDPSKVSDIPKDISNIHIDEEKLLTMCNFIGMPYDEQRDEQWLAMFNSWKSRKDQLDPVKDKQVNTWVKKQRQLRRKGSLKKYRFDMLDREEGFVWEYFDELWTKSYLELKSYIESHPKANSDDTFVMDKDECEETLFRWWAMEVGYYTRASGHYEPAVGERKEWLMELGVTFDVDEIKKELEELGKPTVKANIEAILAKRIGRKRR